MTSEPIEPDVSVIVIVFNDARRIERAVRSVLAQTLRGCEVVIVDDASTDATPEVVRRLVAAAPDRVRALRLAENSGSGGRPRNVGMAVARGRYVMFLDSDDALDRHACHNLLSAAEQTGVDLVIGRCVRHYVERGREQSWLPWLFERRTVITLAEEPRLLYDVLSTNKLYRRRFLIREKLAFPEGRLYEDNLFTAHAYLTADRIAIIPHRIYTWYVEQRAGTPSVTNRSRHPRNLVDRISITRDIDDLLGKYGTPELQLCKDIRFIENDLRTHLARVGSLPEEQRRTLVDIAAPYTADLDPRAFEQADRLAAVAAYLVSRRDYAGVAAAYEYLVPRGRKRRLLTDLVERHGRVYWCDRHLDDPMGAAVLDVTDLGLHHLPLHRIGLGSSITRAETTDGQVLLTGEITNPLGRITPEARPRAVLEFSDRNAEDRRVEVPARLEIDRTRVRWRATLSPRGLPRPIGFVDALWSVSLRLVVDRDTARLSLFAEPEVVESLRFPVRPWLTRVAGDQLAAYVTDAGQLAARLTAHGRLARAGAGLISRLRSTSAGNTWWARVRAMEANVLARLTSTEVKRAVYHRVLTRLPIRRRLVVFESHLGRQYGDSPKYVYLELRRAGLPYQAVWAHSRNPAGFPHDAKLVRRESWAYYRALARARFWVDNQGFPHALAKRRGTTYIQTWHGSAFKRMGSDTAEVKRLSRGRQEHLARAIGRFDAFLIRSAHDERTLVKGLGVRGELLPVGYPRNDPLVNGGDPAELAALRRGLGIDDGRRVVLYAPTFRPASVAGTGTGTGTRARALTLPFDVRRYAELFGDDMVLLVRPHYLANFVLPLGLGGAVRNVAHVDDVTTLLLLADALVTDYSSIMFDFALLDRPMVFHVPDHEDYVDRGRGSYFDLAEHAPGPVTHDDEQLFAALADLESVGARYARQRRAFVERFGEYDHGGAAKAVVDRFFRGRGRRG
jgi:CDP-glycerol glycerophosphotransferase